MRAALALLVVLAAGCRRPAAEPGEPPPPPAAPMVAFRSPAPGQVVSASEVDVAATVEAALDVKEATLQVDGLAPRSLQVNGKELSAKVAVAPGLHRLVVQVTDAWDRVATAQVDFTRADVRPPTIAMTGPADEQLLVYSATVRGSIVDDVAVASAECVRPDGSVEPVALDGQGAFSLTVQPVPGENLLVVRAQDAAGNRSEQSLRFAFARRVSAGSQHSGLVVDGGVIVWGRDHLGQLGLGAAPDGGSSLPAGSTTVGVRVPSLSGVVSLAFGGISSLALTADGRVFAWGDNGDGQLGQGASADGGVQTGNLFEPRPVPGLTGAVAASLGFAHALVLLRDGSVQAFGSNASGQLGDGSTTSRSVALPVSGLTEVVQLAGGSQHSVALRRDGTVWVWGRNAYGNLGNGAADTQAHPVPTAVPGLKAVVQVATGRDHVVALLSDGTARTWGLNASGQLGDGTKLNAAAPVVVVGLSGAVEVGANGNMSFARLANGTAVAWGQNGNGSLGVGDTEEHLTFASVKAPGTLRQLAIGNLHGLALDATSTLWSWGWNFRGTLGGGMALKENWAYPEPIQVVLP